LNPSKTRHVRSAKVRADTPFFGESSMHASVSIGTSTFPARLEPEPTSATRRALMQLLPYSGTALHVRWSGEAVWSPLRAAWPVAARLPEENAITQPLPGQLLLYASAQSEPEILLAYGETRFACSAGPLRGNPILTIVYRLDELAEVGRSLLEHGAATLRIELAPLS
jgi:hypothetical protein